MTPDTKISAIEYLSTATQAEPVGENAVDAYLRGLEHFSDVVVSEACARLALTEQRFPPLARVVEECRVVLAEMSVEQTAERAREELQAWSGPVPKARAKVWMDHLEAVGKALKAGEKPPPAPEVLDSADQLFRCQVCRDLGWIERECSGGSRRSCGRWDKSTHIQNPSPTAGGIAAMVTIGTCRSPHPYVERCICKAARSA